LSTQHGLRLINALVLVEDFQSDSDDCTMAQRWSSPSWVQTASGQSQRLPVVSK